MLLLLVVLLSWCSEVELEAELAVEAIVGGQLYVWANCEGQEGGSG